MKYIAYSEGWKLGSSICQMSGFAHTGLGLLMLITGLGFLPTILDVILVILENISNTPRYGEHLQPDRHLRLSLGYIQRKGINQGDFFATI